MPAAFPSSGAITPGLKRLCSNRSRNRNGGAAETLATHAWGHGEQPMRKLFQICGASAALLLTASISALAACNGDTGTETVLGAASGAAVGGLASHSVAGAAIGGVAGGVIGNSIGRSNNREDCRREAQYYDQENRYQGQDAYGRDEYSQRNYQQQDYAQRHDYDRPRETYEQQRQSYYSRYPSVSAGSHQYYSNGYNDGTYSGSSRYSDHSQSSRYPDGLSSQYPNYSNGE